MQWIDDAGPGGWNNLDSLDVGNGAMDGLTNAERQSYMTLWAIEAAPLYTGDDLTKLDPYGLSLLTNDEVIAVDQAGRAGQARRQPHPAADLVRPQRRRQLHRRAVQPGRRDRHRHRQLGRLASTARPRCTTCGATRISPRPTAPSPRRCPRTARGCSPYGPAAPPWRPRAYQAESSNNTLTGSAAVYDCAACSGGKKVGNLYGSARLQFNNVTVKKDGIYTITVAYVDGSSDRTAIVSSNTGSGTKIAFPNTGDWNTVHSISFQLGLKAGSNSITFDSAGWYSPDIDKIDVPTSS